MTLWLTVRAPYAMNGKIVVVLSAFGRIEMYRNISRHFFKDKHMFVKVVESNASYQSEDFRRWIREHQGESFKVIGEFIGNDDKPVYQLKGVNFRISKRFCEAV